MSRTVMIGLLCFATTGCMHWAHPVSTYTPGPPQPASRAVQLKTHLDNTQAGPTSQRVLVDVAESYLEQTRILVQQSAATETRPDAYAVAYLAEQAAATYEVLAETYPEWPMRPQALWYLGLLLEQVDASADADRWWDTLLDRYPNSEASAKVRIRRGRHALRVAHDDDAANQWLMPVTQRNDILAAEANYWLGWVHVNTGDSKRALKRFLAAALATRKTNPPLHRQAVLDSILPFSLAYPNRTGINTYQKLCANRSIYTSAIEKLARRAQTLANHPIDIELVREMARLDTDAVSNDQRVSYMYQAHVDTDFAHVTVEDVSLFSAIHRQLALSDHPAETYDVAYDDMVFDLVMHLHTQWESKKEAGVATTIAAAWNEYVAHPRRRAHRTTAYQNMARLYDFSGDTVQAADAWSAFATLQSQDTTWTQTGGSVASAAHRETIARYLDAYGAAEDKRSLVARRSLSGLIRHIEPIETHMPSHVAAPVMYRIARAHHEAQAHDVAEAIYRRIITHHPSAEQAVAGTQALLALQNLKGDSDAFLATLEWLQTTQLVAHPDIRQEVARLVPILEETQRAELVAAARQDGPDAMTQLMQTTADTTLRTQMQIGLVEQNVARGALEDAAGAFAHVVASDTLDDTVYVAASQLAVEYFLSGRIEDGLSVLQSALRQDSPKDYRTFVQEWMDAQATSVPLHRTNSRQWMDAEAQVQQFRRVLHNPEAFDLQTVVAAYAPVRDALLHVAQEASDEEAVQALAAVVAVTRDLGTHIGTWTPPDLPEAQKAQFQEALKTHSQGLTQQALQYERQCAQLVQARQIMSTAALACLGRTASEAVRPKLARIAPAAVAKKRLLKQPGTPEDIAALAQELHDGGQHKLALLLIDVGLNHAPSNGTLRRVKGDIYWIQGELGLASEWWGRAAQAGDSIAQETVQNISEALTPRTITASVWAP